MKNKTPAINHRKIPATMVTQHPDHAAKPYWHTQEYITTNHETEEAYRSFADLGATEYKWDWEGKLVDESVLERLFSQYLDFFKKNPLGEKTFLTFRLPNPRVETEFRLGRAFMNMISSASIAKHLSFAVPPLFEVILPMTETAEEMLSLQEAFEELRGLKHPLYKMDNLLTNVRVIPLFESVDIILSSDKILEKYLRLYKKRFKKQPPYMRPYVARSDPALNSGIIPTVLAIKIALAHFKALEKRLKIPMYPIIGAAALPFRGGLAPDKVEDFIQEYSGIRTTTIQSAFRYDYSLDAVKQAIKKLEKELPKGKVQSIPVKEEKDLRKLIQASDKYYKELVEKLSSLVNIVSSHIPKRRERFLHVGLFGYSRGEGKVKLPRAIGFTASLYSLGIPPELLGTGQTLEYARKHKQLPLLEKYYKKIKKDILRAGRFVNKENIQELAETSVVGKILLKEIEAIESYLGEKLVPATKEEKKHQEITRKIFMSLDKKKSLSKLITEAGVLRKSLG